MNHESIELPPDKSANLRRVTAGKQWQFSRVRSVIKCIANGEVQRVGVNPMDVQLVLLGENSVLPLRFNGFLLSKEVRKCRYLQAGQGKIKAGLQGVSSTVQALTINVLEERMTVGPILSASDAPEGYRPFKCVACGLEGMAAPSKRARKFCYAPCKADIAGRVERRTAMPAPHSKICTRCGETKPVDQFSKDARAGYKASCKSCRNTEALAYAGQNKDKKAANWAARKADPESHGRKLAQGKAARDAARALVPEWDKRVSLHDAHVKAERIYFATRYSAHVDAWMLTADAPVVLHDAQVNAFKREKAAYREWRYLNDPTYSLYDRIRTGVRRYVQYKSPARVWRRRLGYTMAELRDHLERQFTKGMSWANMDRWHVDHVVAASTFNIESVYSPEFNSCFGLHNLRPLWATENIKKGAKREFLL